MWFRRVVNNRCNTPKHQVKCLVLSTVSNDYIDAYLLSESSKYTSLYQRGACLMYLCAGMFVYPRQLVLKTCGTTTLLNAIPEYAQFK